LNHNLTPNYICGFKFVNWSDLAWACERSIIPWNFAVDFARENVTSDSPEIEKMICIAPRHLEFDLIKMIMTLTDKNQGDELSVRRKWLFIILKWVYINRDDYKDPLEEVEIIYADFEYPEVITPFVRYMPPDKSYNPRNFEYSENINRLYSNWKRYLDIEEAKLSSKSINEGTKSK